MAGSVAEAVKDADVVLLNLPTNEAVEDALGKLLPVLRAPQLVVDFSTIPVEACRSHAATLARATGCRWVDAPVSGGPPAGEARPLTVRAGGRGQEPPALPPL